MVTQFARILCFHCVVPVFFYIPFFTLVSPTQTQCRRLHGYAQLLFCFVFFFNSLRQPYRRCKSEYGNTYIHLHERPTYNHYPHKAIPCVKYISNQNCWLIKIRTYTLLSSILWHAQIPGENDQVPYIFLIKYDLFCNDHNIRYNYVTMEFYKLYNMFNPTLGARLTNVTQYILKLDYSY